MDTEKVGGKLFVGQNSAKELFKLWQLKNNYPHFILIAGETGSGRKSLAYLFAQMVDAQVAVVSDLAVSNVRSVIEAAYNIDAKMVYLFTDADGMSLAAKNSLLKFTEEPPENAYIIMTLQAIENTLFTLQSRSQHIVTVPYTFNELKQLCDEDRLCKIATTPGMLIRLQALPSTDVDSMIDTATKLVNYIDKVSLANALKSAASIKFKDSDKGIEFDLLIATIRYILEFTAMQNLDTSDVEAIYRSACWLRALSQWQSKFSYSGVNKKALYDQFIMEVRNRLGGANV